MRVNKKIYDFFSLTVNRLSETRNNDNRATATDRATGSAMLSRRRADLQLYAQHSVNELAISRHPHPNTNEVLVALSVPADATWLGRKVKVELAFT